MGDERDGIADWKEQDIVSFLKTGGTPNAAAFGPMSEVVHYSTSAMSDDDLKAIAVYLKSLPATKDHETPNRPAAGVAEAGQAIYVDTCSACHGEHGQEVPAMFPPLKGSAIVQGADPTKHSGQARVSTAVMQWQLTSARRACRCHRLVGSCQTNRLGTSPVMSAAPGAINFAVASPTFKVCGK